MTQRPSPLVALLTYGLLGLHLGSFELAQLIRYPLERYRELRKSLYPASVTWVGTLRPLADWLELTDRLRVAGTVVLLLAVLYHIATTLNPRFNLVKPAEVNPGRGMNAHLEVSLLLRIAGLTVISFWLLGMFRPLAALVGDSALRFPLFFVVGGVPVWSDLASAIIAQRSTPLSPLAAVAGAVFNALVAITMLWGLWGPRGPLGKDPDASARGVLRWAILGGLAAAPAILLLRSGSSWISAFAQAISLDHRADWTRMLVASVALPIVAVVALAPLPYVFRPRLVLPRRDAGVTLLSLGLLLLAMLVPYPVRAALTPFDADAISLGRTLRLEQPALMRRFALVLAPTGESLYSIAPDGSGEGEGARIPCNGQSVAAVQQFLDRKRFQSQLVFPAYFHLKTCTLLDWLTTQSMELDLEMLRKAPAPAAGEFLREALLQCEVTPKNRAILDQVAASGEFLPPKRGGATFLGGAYLHFGDERRAREHLVRSDLAPAQLEVLLDGKPLLTQGVVRGQLTMEGRARPLVRLGLVPAGRWQMMVGNCRPSQWRAVMSVTYTDAAGRFTFRNVPGGAYVLVMTGDIIGRRNGTPVVEPHPGAFGLDAQHPVRDLGKFNLRFVPVPAAPRGSAGEIASLFQSVLAPRG